MIIFVIFNLFFSTLLIIAAIFFIKQINEDIKEDEKNKKYDIKATNKEIKIANIFKLFNYFIIVFVVLVILFTLFIFIINLLEVL